VPILEASNSWALQGLSRPVIGFLYLLGQSQEYHIKKDKYLSVTGKYTSIFPVFQPIFYLPY
jgi:hypothetical protein